MATERLKANIHICDKMYHFYLLGSGLLEMGFFSLKPSKLEFADFFKDVKHIPLYKLFTFPLLVDEHKPISIVWIL